jgi:L-lactate permease
MVVSLFIVGLGFVPLVAATVALVLEYFHGDDDPS